MRLAFSMKYHRVFCSLAYYFLWGKKRHARRTHVSAREFDLVWNIARASYWMNLPRGDWNLAKSLCQKFHSLWLCCNKTKILSRKQEQCKTVNSICLPVLLQRKSFEVNKGNKYQLRNANDACCVKFCDIFARVSHARGAHRENTDIIETKK